MSQSNQRPKTTEELILAFFDGQLHATEQEQLGEMLAHSAEARALFESYMRLEGVAVELGQAQCLTSIESSCGDEDLTRVDRPQTASQTSRGPKAAQIQWAKRIVAYGIALVLGAWLAYHWNGPVDPPAGQSVGHISRIVAADWVSPSQDIGSDIRVGSYELRDGLVELEFDNGARIILEGPANFEVASSEQTILHYGRMRTHVPPEAYGFVIDTPSMKVVDLGTEFGLEIDAAGSAEVHVFDGEVEVYDEKQKTTQSRLLLAAGQAIRVDHSGQRSEIPADVDAFVDRLTLESRASTHVEELTTKLEELHQRQRQLNEKLKKAEETTRRSGDLVQLNTAAKAAKRRWLKQQNSHPELKRAMAKRDRARGQVNQLYRDAIVQSEEGRQLLDRLTQTNDEFASLKKKLVELKSAKRPSPELRNTFRQFRRVQKQRNELRAEMRAYRNKLRSDDQKIRKGTEELARARRQVDRVLNKPEVDALRAEAAELQKNFLSMQRKRLQSDEQIGKLKREQYRVRQQARKLKREIQQARQAAESFELMVEI